MEAPPGPHRTVPGTPTNEAPPPPPQAPHVIYQTGKKPDEPCSITSSLNYFPEDEAGEVNVTSPPRSPPSNLTVVTVEGCPSFVILDWEKPDNDTTGREERRSCSPPRPSLSRPVVPSSPQSTKSSPRPKVPMASRFPSSPPTRPTQLWRTSDRRAGVFARFPSAETWVGNQQHMRTHQNRSLVLVAPPDPELVLMDGESRV